VKPQVLIVDDLPFMRTLIRNALQTVGMEIIGEAQNGKEGIRQYVMLEPDLVVLDINMPVMDGVAALKKIRRYDPKAKVVMCSALDEKELIVEAIKLGARDYVVKPFSPRRIVSAVQKALGRLKNRK
jgi:two-component system chemotaxis response regulator CheY